MDFGMGLILSFTDNASAGMNGAVQSLNNLTDVASRASGSLGSLNNTALLSSTAIASQQIGNGLIKAGTGALGLFTKLTSRIRAVGQEYQDYGVSLNALTGSQNKANKQMKKLFEFAQHSPLEVGDVKELLLTLDSQGVNAFKKIKDSTTGANQSFLAYLTDLRSFRPDVQAQRFKAAIQNYVGSGEKKMMRTVFDMGDIVDIIGHKVSDTTEGRMNDIVEMVQKKGLVGLSDTMSKTWTGVASNISDAFTRLFYIISQNDSFDYLKTSFMSIATVITKIPTKDIDRLGKVIAGGLNIILKPLSKLARGFAKMFKNLINLTKTHPKLVKFGIVLTTIAGALLVVGGVAFKVIGTLANFALVLKMLQATSGSVSGVLSSGFRRILTSIAPFALASAGMYLAWRTNFCGIRDLLIDFVYNVQESFSRARSIWSSEFATFNKSINELANSDNFWDKVTLGIVKVIAVFQILKDAWNDDEISAENFRKMNKLGIEPLIVGILQLKYFFGNFVRGFKAGWSEMSKSAEQFIKGVFGKIKDTPFQGLANDMNKFFGMFRKGDAKAWYEFGRSFAHIVGKVIATAVAFKALSSILGKVSKFFFFLGTIGKAISGLANGGKFIVSVFSKIGSAVRGLFSIGSITDTLETIITQIYVFGTDALIPAIKGVVSGVLGFLGTLSAPVIAVLAVLFSGIIAFAVTHWKEFKDGIVSIFKTLGKELGDCFSTVVGGVERIWKSIVNNVSPIADAFGNLKNSVSGIFNAIKDSDTFTYIIDMLSSVGEFVFDTFIPLMQGVIQYISTSFQGVFDTIITIITGVVNIVGSAISGIINIIAGVFDIILGIFTGNTEKIKTGLGLIGTSILNLVVTFGNSIVNVVISILGGLLNKGRVIVMTIVNTIGGAFKGVMSVIKFVMNRIFDTVSGVWGTISGVIDKVMGVIGGKTQSKWNKIKSTITNAINGAKEAVGNAIEKIKGFFNFSWSLPKIKLPHFSISGSFKLKPPSVPKVSVDWYAKGGVFNKPSVIGVGEAGKEAVMPLERNTEWTTQVARLLSNSMNSIGNSPVSIIQPQEESQFVPTGNSVSNNTVQNIKKVYDNSTQNNGNSQVDSSKDFNIEVKFEKGSIVMDCSGNEQEDVDKFVELLIRKIKRKKEIKEMLNYA